MRLRQVVDTWWPLAASWLMMGLELPAVSAVMARLPGPEISLAAYGGVVFPVSLMIEAPIIMLLSASTALCRDRRTYDRLRRFMLLSGGALTLLHLAVAATPLFDFVVEHVLGTPEAVRPAARLGLLVMTPWTASIAYRRFQQGVLIRFGRSRLVGVGTAVRLAANFAVLAAGFAHGGIPGILVGTSAVIAGVLAEAIFVGVAVRPVLRGMPAERPGVPPITAPAFIAFYTPLALTSLMSLIPLPLGSAAMGRLPLTIESLAVWPVINGLVFALRSLGFAYNETVLALIDRPGAYAALRRFALLLASSASLLLLIVTATPLSRLWFADVSGLAPHLVELARRAVWIAVPFPALSAAQHWLTGIVTNAGRTRAIGESTAIGLGVTGTALLAAIAFVRAPGIQVYLACALMGYASQTLWLVARSRPLRAQHAAAAAAAACALLAAASLAPSPVAAAPAPALTAAAPAPGSAAAGAARLPDGFALETVVGGPFADAPVAFAFLPDGRVLIAERASGIVRCAAAGAGTSDSVHTVPDVEAAAPERGLLGIAVDPEWPSRPFVYLDYTHADGFTKVVRWRAEGALDDAAGTAIALADPLEILPDVPDLHPVHNAGALRFGPDGMLYVATGDDARACEAQRPESPLGKILRLDVSRLRAVGGGAAPRGAIVPAGNPWPGTDGWRPLVYAWGLRNPFRFTVDAATGALFIGNVGWNDYEEIERVAGPSRDNNLGWPVREGGVRVTFFGECRRGTTLRDPIHAVPHPAGPVAVTGGPVMRPVEGSPRSFPPDYHGDLFYFEFYGGTLHRLRGSGDAWAIAPPAPGQPAPDTWADGLPSVVDAQLGPDGALWFLALGFGTEPGLFRIAPDAPRPDRAAVHRDPAEEAPGGSALPAHRR
jgi:glucose/arabinose dehydrogenase